MCEAHFTLAQPIYHRTAISYLRSKYFTLRSNIFRGVAQPPARFFGQQHRSAAGGGCSEVLLAQRSKLRAAPRRKRFRAPQEGEQSSANIFVLITNHFSLTTEYRGVAQLVARLLWEQDAGCSSHLTPTKKKRLLSGAAKGVFCAAKQPGRVETQRLELCRSKLYVTDMQISKQAVILRRRSNLYAIV